MIPKTKKVTIAAVLGLTFIPFMIQQAGAQLPSYTVPGGVQTLNGTSDYSTNAYDPTMAAPSLTGKMSMSAWVSPNQTDTPQMVFKREGAYQLQVNASDDPRFSFTVWTSNGVHSLVSDLCVDTLRWQHIAGTYDGTNCRVYHNGRLVGSLTVSGGFPAAGSLPPSAPFSTDANTVLLWHLDENTGTSTADAATGLGGANNGTITANTTWTTGKFGAGLNAVAGDSGDVRTTLGAGLFTSQQITMDAWIKPTVIDASGSYVMGFDNGSGGDPYAFVRLASGTSGGVGFRVTSGGTQWAAVDPSFGGVNVLDGNWHHIAGTLSNGVVRMYLDGALIGTDSTYAGATLAGTPGRFVAAGNAPWSIGGTGANYIGAIDEVRLSNIARSNFGATTSPTPMWVGANLVGGTPQMFFGGNLSDMRVYDVALTSNQVVALTTNPPATLPPPVGSSTRTQAVNGTVITLEVGNGLRLNQIGGTVSSGGGRLFVVNVNGSPISSDRVTVRQGEITTLNGGWQIPFDLPGGQGTGVLEFLPGSTTGFVLAKLSLTNSGASGDWQVAFPHLEGMSLNGLAPANVEFFFPFLDGWIGRGLYDIKAGYGISASLPVVAAWHTNGPGIAIQGRDTNFIHSVWRCRNTATDIAPTNRHVNYDNVENIFHITKPGATLARYSLPFTLGTSATWSAPGVAIQVFAGTNKFKDVLSTYGQWARANWWTRDPVPATLRDRFVSVPHWENNNGNWWGGDAETIHDSYHAHPTFETAYWWDHEESISCVGGGTYSQTQGNYDFEPNWGGAPAYAADVARCSAAGVSTLYYLQHRIVWKQSQVGLAHKTDWGWMHSPGVYNTDWTGDNVGGCIGDYWSMCPQATGWHQYLSNACVTVLQGSGADGVRLDTATEYLVCYNPNHPHTDSLKSVSSFYQTVRSGVKAVGADKYMMVEAPGSDVNVQSVDGSLAQAQNAGNLLGIAQMDRYGVLPFRFVYPELKLFEWGDQSSASKYHRASRRMLFNGVGTTMGTGISSQVAELFHFSEVMRGLGDVFASTNCEPLYPTMKQGVVANRFSLNGREVYTLWNQSGAQTSGQTLRIPGATGRRFVNLVTGRTLSTTYSGGADIVSLTIPNDEVVMIGVFPVKLIQSTDGTSSQTFTLQGAQPFSLQAVDAATDQVLVSGGSEITVDDSLLPGRTVVVRAVSDGYLVHDSFEVDPYYPHEYTPDASTVVLWHLNDGSGPFALDAANPILGGNNSGTLTGPAVSWTNGMFGTGLHFVGGTGASQPGNIGYVTTPIPGSLFTNKQVTMAAWVKPTRINPTFGANYIMGWSGPDTAGAFLRFGSATSLGFGVRVRTAGGTYQWAEVSYSTPFNVLDGIWRNVAGTFNDGVLKLYVNGVEVAVNNSGYTSGAGYYITPPSTFLIGGVFDSPGDTRLNYAGYMDEVRLVNTLPVPLPLPPSPPPTTEHAPDSRTVLLWHLNENTGSTTADAATPLLDGANNGTIWANNTWTPGAFGSGLNSLSTGAGYVSAPLGPGLFTTKATMEAWIRPTAIAPGASYVMGWTGPGTTDSFLRLYTGTSVGVGFRVTNGSAYWAQADFNLPVNLLNNWNHIAGTFSEGVVRIYLNGTLMGSYNTGYGPGWKLMQPTMFVAAGGAAWDPTGSGGGRYIGDIDEVRLSNMERTDFSTVAVTPTVSIAWSGSNVVVTYDGVLQSAPAVTGTYTNVPGATNPYTNSPSATERYFRSRGP